MKTLNKLINRCVEIVKRGYYTTRPISKLPMSRLNNRLIKYIDTYKLNKVSAFVTKQISKRIHEDTFMYKILTPEKITNDMIAESLDENMCVIRDVERYPGENLSDISTPNKYMVPLRRVTSMEYTKDIDELRLPNINVCNVLCGKPINDISNELDNKFITVCNGIVKNTKDNKPGVNLFTNKVQYKGLKGGLTKDNFIEAKKMLPHGVTGSTKYRYRNFSVLMNDVTAHDFMKMNCDEVGTETVQEMWRNGMENIHTVLGVNAIFTIRRDIVPDDIVYFFIAPEFLGRYYYLQDWTAYMTKQCYYINLIAYSFCGFAISNVAGVCMADFNYKGK